MSEHDDQAALIEWARMNEAQLPGVDLLHSIPNGGGRTPRQAATLKAEGVLAGVPDLFLPIARHDFHGMYIEMKTINNGRKTYPTAEQREMHTRLSGEGYLVRVCWTWEEAAEWIERYLNE